MAYHPSKIDYSNRTVDLLLLQVVSEPVADAAVNVDISAVPRMVTGIEKLVQRYAQIFLTQIGTVKHRNSEGTEFMTLLGGGRVYDENTLLSAASLANKSTFRQIVAEDSSNDTPDDERLSASEIKEVSISRATAMVSVTVQITSAAGDTYTYITPIATGF